MSYDIMVIGGGAAGLMAACTAADSGKEVILLEANDSLGKKILSTGNGRCNFTNDYMGEECFRTDSDHQKMKHILESFSKDDTLAFFEKMGVCPKIRFGTGYYPLSMQASQVRDAFCYAVKKRNITVVTNFKCKTITQHASGYKAVSEEGKSFTGTKCIIATGGLAAPKSGSDGAMFHFLKASGFKTKDVVPALVPLKCRENFFKKLQGVRWESQVSYKNAESRCISNQGELQFTKEGISGIPVFQISRFIAKDLLHKKSCEVQIDLYPDFSQETLQKLLEMRFYEEGWYKTNREALVGLMHDKLIDVILQEAGIPSEQMASSISEGQLRSIIRLCKKFTVTVTDTKGFEFSQTTAGGIDLSSVSSELEYVGYPGLYFAGEILDVDGICGGYNLQWAWASGYMTGRSASDER